MMYDELIKNLRHDSASALQNCEFDFVHSWMLEAADAIEELVKENESLAADLADSNERRKKKRKPQWIPVTERLPPIGEEVIVFADRTTIRIWSLERYHPTIADVFWEREDGYHEDTDVVTHWMPLPQPPESESE